MRRPSLVADEPVVAADDVTFVCAVAAVVVVVAVMGCSAAVDVLVPVAFAYFSWN